jgi:hypothetical protein
MKATFELPSGLRVRTQTVRDYVLVKEGGGEAWIERRSDSAATIEAVAARFTRAGTRHRMYFGDTRTATLRDLP